MDNHDLQQSFEQSTFHKVHEVLSELLAANPEQYASRVKFLDRVASLAQKCESLGAYIPRTIAFTIIRRCLSQTEVWDLYSFIESLEVDRGLIHTAVQHLKFVVSSAAPYKSYTPPPDPNIKKGKDKSTAAQKGPKETRGQKEKRKFGGKGQRGPGNKDKKPKIAEQTDSSAKLDTKPDIHRCDLESLPQTTAALPALAATLAHGSLIPSHASVVDEIAELPQQDTMFAIIADVVQGFHSRNLSRYQRVGTKEQQASSLEASSPEQPEELSGLEFNTAVVRIEGLFNALGEKQEQKNVLESWFFDLIQRTARLDPKNTGELTRAEKSRARSMALKLMTVVRRPSSESSSHVTRMQQFWTILAVMRRRGANFVVTHRGDATNARLIDDSAERLREDEVIKWIPTIDTIHRHLETYVSSIAHGSVRPSAPGEQQAAHDRIVNPCLWSSAKAQWTWIQRQSDKSILNTCSTISLLRYGYRGKGNQSWAVARVVGGVSGASMAIAPIPAGSFLGVLPGLLYTSLVRKATAIPGPDGIWLDLDGRDGNLGGIATGRAEEANVIVGWDICGDAVCPTLRSCRALVFSTRAINVFQKLVRWNGVERKLDAVGG